VTIDGERRYQELLRQAKQLMPGLAGDHVLFDRIIAESASRQKGQPSRHSHGKNRIWNDRDQARDGSPKERPLYVMYLDESGDHHLDQMLNYPIFTLCGIVIRDGYPTRRINRALGKIKDDCLQSDEIPLHWFNICTRNKHYSILGDPTRNRRFHNDLDVLRTGSDYTIIAAVIDKMKFFKQCSTEPVDSFLPVSPYAICLDFIIERFLHFLWNHGQSKGRVIAEARGERENSELQYEFLRLGLYGTQYASERWMRYHLRPVIKFRQKKECVCGLELADIVAGPIAAKCLNRQGTPLGWDSLKGRFYDGGEGRPESYGLKIFPDPATPDMFQ